MEDGLGLSTKTLLLVVIPTLTLSTARKSGSKTGRGKKRAKTGWVTQRQGEVALMPSNKSKGLLQITINDTSEYNRV